MAQSQPEELGIAPQLLQLEPTLRSQPTEVTSGPLPIDETTPASPQAHADGQSEQVEASAFTQQPRVQPEWNVVPTDEVQKWHPDFYADPGLENEEALQNAIIEPPSFVSDGRVQISDNLLSDDSFTMKQQRVFKVRVVAKSLGASGVDEEGADVRVDKDYYILLLLGSGRSVSLYMRADVGKGGIGTLCIGGLDQTRPVNMIAFHDVDARLTSASFNKHEVPSTQGTLVWQKVEDFTRSISKANGEFFRFASIAGRYQGSAHWTSVMMNQFKKDRLIRYGRGDQRTIKRFLRNPNDLSLDPTVIPLMPGCFISPEVEKTRQFSKAEAEQAIEALSLETLHALALAVSPGWKVIQDQLRVMGVEHRFSRRQNHDRLLMEIKPVIKYAATMSEYGLTAARDLLNASDQDTLAFLACARDAGYHLAKEALINMLALNRKWDQPIYALIAVIDLNQVYDPERRYK